MASTGEGGNSECPRQAHPFVEGKSLEALRLALEKDGSDTASSAGGLFPGLFRALTGSNSAQAEAEAAQQPASGDLDDEEPEYVPLVLVVGAAGRTGRLIVRKPRGFTPSS